MRNLILEFAIHGSESPESVKAAFAAGLEALDSAAAPVADEDLARSGRGTEFGRLDHALTVLADAPARDPCPAGSPAGPAVPRRGGRARLPGPAAGPDRLT